MRNKLILYATSIILVAILIFPLSQSYASSNPQILDMTIQLFFVTSESCDKIQLETIKFYAEIIDNYFRNYGYRFVSIDHQCATTQQIDVLKDDSGPFYKYNQDYDLVIFIPDKKESKRYMPAKSAYGHYGWSTDPPEIVSSTEYLDIFNIQAVWTLSHELSHFILHNLGYPETVWAGDGPPKSYVHKTDKIFDDEHCWLQIVPTTSCKNTYYKLESSNGQTFRVMAIYDKPISISIQKITLPKNSYTIDETMTVYGEIKNYDPRISEEVTIRISDPAKRVVVNEKIKPNYDDGTFTVFINPEKSIWSNFGTYSVTALYSNAVKTIPFTLSPEYVPEKIPSNFINTETVLFINKNIVFGYFDNNEKICFNISVHKKGSSVVVPYERVTLKVMPTGKVYDDWIIPSWSYPLDEQGRAEHCMIWDSRNDRVNVQAEYQGNQYTSSSKSDVLWLDSSLKPAIPQQPTITPTTPENSQLRLKVEFFSAYDKNRNFLTTVTVNEELSFGFRVENKGLNGETVKIYVPIRDTNGNLVTTMETQEEFVSPAESIIIRTNYWKPQIAGNYFAIVAPAVSNKDPTLIASGFTFNFIVEPRQQTSPSIQPNDVVPSKTLEEFCREKGYLWYKNECFTSEQALKDSQKQNEETLRELGKLKEQAINKINDLEERTSSVEQSLLGIEYQNKDSQEKINEAWTALKLTKERLSSMNERILEGDASLELNNFEDARTLYTLNQIDIDIINTHLERIPDFIDEAKNLSKSKFCFLFWCW